MQLLIINQQLSFSLCEVIQASSILYFKTECIELYICFIIYLNVEVIKFLLTFTVCSLIIFVLQSTTWVNFWATEQPKVNSELAMWLYQLVYTNLKFKIQVQNHLFWDYDFWKKENSGGEKIYKRQIGGRLSQW